MIVVLGDWLLPAPTAPRCTGPWERRRSAPAGGIVVVFDPATPEADLRRILREAGARIVDGPTQANAYVLDVPAPQRSRRSGPCGQSGARLVEPLGLQAPMTRLPATASTLLAFASRPARHWIARATRGSTLARRSGRSW